MLKLIQAIIITILLSTSTSAQIFKFSKEISFAKYLQNKDQIAEAEWVLHNVDTALLNSSEKDSLFFEIGWLAYNNKKLDTAAQFLQKVSSNDARYNQSIFFASYSNSFKSRYNNAYLILNKINASDSLLQELKQFELAGISLLNKDYSGYQKHKSSFSYNSYILNQEEQNFSTYEKSIFYRKDKSPFIAGLLSTILPGAGKWYAGKKKQAIGALLPILSAGILMLEAYNKSGITDARFWIYGTVFTTFYIGNIWGSAMAVKVRNTELKKLYEDKILLDMQIPLRKFFN